MRARLEKFIDQLRSSYWFIPGLMALAAILLATGMVWLDGVLGQDWLESIEFISASRPQGARAILTAIGGSMIGVAGTVFSVTMAAVVYASGQYGPRLLTQFLSDRGNQFTLGTFTATFVYSMLVLRTIQSADEAAKTGGEAFVPDLALFVCIVLALCSIGVLIFFIHHVPTRIHISNVIASIGRSLLEAIDSRFPAYIGKPAGDAETQDMVEWQLPAPFRNDADQTGETVDFAEVEAETIGYIQFLNETTLINAARRHDLVVRLNIRPGSYIFPGRVIFDVWPAERLTREARAELLSSIATGARRTPTNDMLFLVDEMVEIIARALSPGVNDPSTATTCLDWMGAALAELGSRDMPDPLRTDEEGILRVVTSPHAFADYLRMSFGSIREYVAADKMAARHFLFALGLVARRCQAEDRLEALRGEASNMVELCRKRLAGHSLHEVETEAAIFESVLAHPRHRAPFPPLHDTGAKPAADEKPKKTRASSGARKGARKTSTSRSRKSGRKTQSSS